MLMSESTRWNPGEDPTLWEQWWKRGGGLKARDGSDVPWGPRAGQYGGNGVGGGEQRGQWGQALGLAGLLALGAAVRLKLGGIWAWPLLL